MGLGEFVEYHPWNIRMHQYGDLPDVDVTFNIPTSSSGEGGEMIVGGLGDAYEYADRVGRVGLR